jgi:hypothetical protein
VPSSPQVYPNLRIHESNDSCPETRPRLHFSQGHRLGAKKGNYYGSLMQRLEQATKLSKSLEVAGTVGSGLLGGTEMDPKTKAKFYGAEDTK